MNSEIKVLIDELQTRIVSETISDNVLYIFDTMADRDIYYKKLVREHKNTPDKILLTIEDLLYRNKLIGLRYKSFHFMDIWNKE